MHFLNAQLLWLLLPLVGIPLIIHWLSRRFPKKFAFSSIDEIRRSIAGRSRIFRWRHLLMLLLRTLALIALLIAFLKPMITTRVTQKGAKRGILLLVDHSLSMTYAENGTSATSRARTEVKRLLNSLDADDQFNLIRVDHAPVAAFTSYSTNAAAALDFLDQSPPPRSRADYRAANQLAAELAKASNGPLDIYYFSDFQRRDWADVEFKTLPPQARLYFVNATDDPARGNQAIVSLNIGQGAVIVGGEIEAKVRVANHSSKPWNGKIEAGFGPADLRECDATLAPWSEGEFSLVVPIPSGGLLKLTASLPSDGLPTDNHRHLVVQVHEREEVVILTGPEKDSSSPAPSLFLTTAVNPFGDNKGVYRPKHLEPETLSPAALAASTRLIASRLPLLNDAQAGSLATFLRSGGGIILFLDGSNDAQNLEKIANLTGETLPIRLTNQLDSNHLPDGAMHVASGDFHSRFLRLFNGVRRQNLALLEFYNLYHAAPSGSGRVLLTYADGTPALTESSIGLGTLLICNFSVAEASSNLARQRLFPAWIHEMLLRMNSNGSAALDSYLVGDSAAAETWMADAIGRDLLGPKNETVRNRMDITGERLRISFTADETGFYHLPGENGNDLLAFAVNTDPDQSDLRSINPTVLPDRAGNSHTDASYVGTTSDYNTLIRGRPVFHWFLLSALALLFIEGILFKSPNRRSA